MDFKDDFGGKDPSQLDSNKLRSVEDVVNQTFNRQNTYTSEKSMHELKNEEVEPIIADFSRQEVDNRSMEFGTSPKTISIENDVDDD